MKPQQRGRPRRQLPAYSPDHADEPGASDDILHLHRTSLKVGLEKKIRLLEKFATHSDAAYGQNMNKRNCVSMRGHRQSSQITTK